MNGPQTISFMGTTELKQQLEEWAAQDDRSVSATLRRILEAEAKRRANKKNTGENISTSAESVEAKPAISTQTP